MPIPSAKVGISYSAAPDVPYVRGMAVGGMGWSRGWLSFRQVAGGVVLEADALCAGDR